MFPALRVILVVVLAVPLQFQAVHAQQNEAPQTLEQLKAAIDEIRQARGIPGLAVAVADAGAGGPVWIEGLGRANIENNVPVTGNTLFRIGSVSKMFVALSVLQLSGEGKLDMHATVRDLAPEVTFTNPWEDTHPVRLVHLLEHTSGWSDMRFPEMAHNDPTPIKLEEAVGLFPQSRVSRWIPGTRRAYSNIGPAVAAYIVQKVTGRKFETYVDEHFFSALDMEKTTYFKPGGDALATGYLGGRPQAYIHLLYRPAGSVNASIHDMSNFLQFMIQRGVFDGNRILNESSITRMETPKTALGAEQGVTAGWGLHNGTSGFGNKGVAFHGHNGGGFGHSAQFAYSPELSSGYVLLMTGDGAAQQTIANLIRGFLLRNTEPYPPGGAALPEQFQNITGLYRPIAPRYEFIRIFTDITGVMHLSSSDSTFHRRPLFGGWQSNDTTVGDNVLVDAWSGLPTVAVVEDPLAGETVAVTAGNLYQPVSALRIYAALTLIALLLSLNAATVIYSPVWIANRLRGRLTGGPALGVRMWPTLNAYISCGYLALLGALLPRTDAGFETIERLGHLTLTSGGIFVAGLLYAAASIAGVISVFRYRNSGVQPRLFRAGLIASLIHLSAVFYLASYGMIGFRSWAG